MNSEHPSPVKPAAGTAVLAGRTVSDVTTFVVEAFTDANQWTRDLAPAIRALPYLEQFSLLEELIGRRNLRLVAVRTVVTESLAVPE